MASSTAVELRDHISEFDTADKLTFYPSIVLLAVWFLNYPPEIGIADFLWASALPIVLVAFMASRRWSALLSLGPAAPVDD
ncbi:hypothetical protein DJ68_14600 [Halorubrum sp. C3]|nr:hypothetical protein DJ68_14600 [Halorubrum sp. C3]